MPHKTNAARLLDQMGISYELREYELDPDDLAAEVVATKIGLPPEQLFKTLVAQGDRHGICMAVIAANMELDLKALAAASGDRKIHLVPVKELLKLTGVVNHGNQPVPVLPNVKDHVTSNVIRIATNFRKIVPANGFHDGCPRYDLVRRIWIIFTRLTQMLQRDDVHETKPTSQYVKRAGQESPPDKKSTGC